MVVESLDGSSSERRPVKHSVTEKDGVRAEGETEKARIERLGRQRPEALKSLWKEAGFVFSIVMSQAITEYFISGMTILIPPIAKALDIPPQAVTWPTSALSVVIAAFLLPFGRLADIYGGFPVYIGGIAWLCIWSLIASFSQNEIMLDVCRAISGLGPAAYLPAGLTLLGNMYRPGPRKNLIFSMYGAMAPLGFYIGLFFAGVVGQYTQWPVYFWIGTGLAFITTIVAYLTTPNDYHEHKTNGVKMDWLGSATTTSGLVLLIFAITDSSYAPRGWSTPYIYVTFVLSILLLGSAVYVEGWVAEQPLVPFSIFKVPNMKPFIIGLLLAYSTLGIFLLYATLYTRHIMNASPMQQVAWYTPLGVGGVFLATLGGLVLHKLPMRVVTFVSCAAIIIQAVLFAVMPPKAGYWPWVFPSMCCATIAIDLIFSAANIFFSTSLPTRQQGLAGAMGNVLLQFSVALGLGFADIVVSSTRHQGEKQSYKNAFWFELALGAAAFVIFMLFVNIKKAKSDYTADEKEAEAQRSNEDRGPTPAT